VMAGMKWVFVEGGGARETVADATSDFLKEGRWGKKALVYSEQGAWEWEWEWE